MDIILRKDGIEKALVPFYRPWDLLAEVDDLARDMWDTWQPFTLDYSLVPHTDIYEEKGQLVMKVELPGINKEDLDISLEGDNLIIKAERKEEVKEETTNHIREMHYGRYFRSITLPYNVKENEISATYHNGILELRLPKVEEVKAKKIELKANIPDREAEKKQLKPKQKKS